MTQKRKICFVRHAKSSWTDPRLSDDVRPLNPRGKRDRLLMSQKFKQDYFIPELLISSHAKRAFNTAKVFAKTFGYSKSDVIIDKKLYHADVDELEEVVSEQSKEYHSIMLFSHNPGLTYLANDYSRDPINNVPTTGIFVLESQSVDWSDFFKTCNLISFIYPKMYV